MAGGAVRDAILGRPVKDVDITVAQGAPEYVGKAFADAIGGALVPLGDGKLIRVVVGDTTVDFTPLRAKTIERDLELRDFTVNAMAVALPVANRVVLLDPTGGRKDLRRKVVRACGPGAFRDDPVRLWRAARLPAALKFKLNPATARAVRQQARLAKRAGAERVRDELFKLLSMDRAAPALEAADRLGVLGVSFPEVERMRKVRIPGGGAIGVLAHTLEALDHLDGLLAKVPAHYRDEAKEIAAHLAHEPVPGRSRRALLRLALLLHDIAKPDTVSKKGKGVHFFEHEHLGARKAGTIMLDRLRCAVVEADIIRRLIALHLRPGHLASAREPVSDKAAWRLLRDAGEEAFELFLHAQADRMATHHGRAVTAPRQRAVIRRMLAVRRAARERTPAQRFVTGHDLMRAFDLKPGPVVGVLLKAVEEAVALGRAGSRAEALAAAERALDREKRRVL